MSNKSLADALKTAGSPVELLRNSQIGPYAFPVVRAEFTNWRDEQRAWRETCALFDQSHHMTDLFLNGPDAQYGEGASLPDRADGRRASYDAAAGVLRDPPYGGDEGPPLDAAPPPVSVVR